MRLGCLLVQLRRPRKAAVLLDSVMRQVLESGPASMRPHATVGRAKCYMAGATGAHTRSAANRALAMLARAVTHATAAGDLTVLAEAHYLQVCACAFRLCVFTFLPCMCLC